MARSVHKVVDAAAAWRVGPAQQHGDGADKVQQQEDCDPLKPVGVREDGESLGRAHDEGREVAQPL